MAKKFFKCRICGDIHYGMNGPVICPTCQNKNTYEPINKEVAQKEMGC